MMKVIITFPTYSVKAEIFDTPTGRAIYEALPIQQNVEPGVRRSISGFLFKANLEEGARAEVSVGDLAYWPNMPAFCIFFGPTPVSQGSQPVAASAVNVFGKLLKADLEDLRGIQEGM